MGALTVYLAGAWLDRARLLQDAAWLFQAPGVVVRARWLWADGSTPDVEAATMDWHDVSSADAVIVDTLGQSSGGRDVEVGIAVALQMPWVLVGPERTVYHALAPWAFGSWHDLREEWPWLERDLRAREAQEVFQLRRIFTGYLDAVSADGQAKRARGLKPPWWRDPGHAEALERHLARWRAGERRDADSGCHPLVHAAWRALALAYQELGGLGHDPGPGEEVAHASAGAAVDRAGPSGPAV